MQVKVGGAHGEKGHPELGDQAQTRVPDEATNGAGEVSVNIVSSVSALKSGWYPNYRVYRPVNPSIGTAIARTMIAACNNPNIGYSIAHRMDIFTYGVNAQVPCGCDCVSLVGFCIANATGDSSIGTSLSTISSNMVNSGVFKDMGPIGGFDDNTNKPCTGDVIVGPNKEHIEVIVQGASRAGGTNPTTPVVGFPIQDYNAGSGVLGGFSPRFTAPDPSEPNYALYYSVQYCENANTSYAWSRFSEILEKLCTLSRGPAQRWYLANEDGYDRGQAPNLGAVMCFTNTEGTGGFVCVVENVGRTEVMVSMFHPDTNAFKVEKISKVDGIWKPSFGSGYFFQGFIYNPKVKVGTTTKSKLTSFIETAKQQINTDGTFTKQQTGYDTATKPWSAAFIVAIAKKVGGLLDVIIPDTYSCSSIGSIGVSEGMGTWHNGPANGGHPYPQAGDIVLFRYISNEGASRYDASKAGIVTLVDPRAKGQSNNVSFTYVVGDSEGKVQNKTTTTDTPMFSGLFRPDWSKVDSLAGAAQQGYSLNGYYAQGTSSQDAAIVDYKYIYASKSETEPSINPTGWMLCAINFSGITGSVYTLFANMLATDSFLSYSLTPGVSDAEFEMLDPEKFKDVEGLTGTVKMPNGESLTLTSTIIYIYAYLRDLFVMNGAGAIGFMANMWAESRFRTNAVHAGSGASGLCQWLGRRRTNLISRVGAGWENNLTGQLDFLKSELEGSYNRSTLNACTSCSWSLMGARTAADYVCRHFEIPVVNNEPKMAAVSADRQNVAAALWTLFFKGAEELG